ncbi:MAG: RagB/SusD family nutrient uptake outer membrane protein [Flavobacteriales bacterium]|nr:MAG: RagB/SusD family nutrient uptake outer membrane protein [Flavobacteriales bacterium]
MKKLFITILSLSTLMVSLNSCRDEVLDPTLTTSKELDDAINNVNDVKAIIAGGYGRMTSSSYYGRDYIIYGEVRSDNTYANGNTNRFTAPASFSMNIEDGDALSAWTQMYRVVASANLVISKEGDASIEGDQTALKQYVGEAYAMRAIAHFDLARLFGQYYVNNGGMSSLGVPYVKVVLDPNALYPTRNTMQEVYDSIMQDLDKSISLMTQDRGAYYLSKTAAYALKSRVALYFEKYAEAKTAALEVINAGTHSIVEANDFGKVFSQDASSSPDVIFAMANNPTDNPGINGLANIYRGNSYADISVLDDLYNAYGPLDVRRGMISTSAPYQNLGKYPDNLNFADDIPLIRYEEVVLNYAEALLKTGNAADALTWLNKVPAKRQAFPYPAATMENILKERRLELAFEGFRGFDLIRTNAGIPLVDPVNQTFTAAIPAGDYKLAFPIPNAEMGANSNMVQNAGY